MSEACSGGSQSGVTGRNAALTAAHGLALAATPTFAVMAAVTALDGGAAGMVCSSGPTSPLSGMATMYGLMAAFHAAPWLKRLREAGKSPRDL